MSYSTFKNEISSEKLSLIFIYPRLSVTGFTSLGSNIWEISVDNVITNLYSGPTLLSVASSASVDVTTPWFYDLSTGKLTYYTTSTSPDDDNIISEIKLFYSNAPITLSYDLGDTSKEVIYEPRVISGIGFKSSIGTSGDRVSLTGSGTVELQNDDGFFDAIFSKYIWENKKVEIYSYNRDLNPSEATLFYRGFIVSKTFNSQSVKFKIQDSIFKLNTQISMNLFTSADNVSKTYQGHAKRHVYGKVDGLLCRSIDQVGTGYTLSGTISGSSASAIVTGSSTTFLTDIAMNDRVQIGIYKYTVLRVDSDTQFQISDDGGLNATFVGFAYNVIPTIASPELNREFFIADHPIRQTTSTVTSMFQFNRLKVADITGFEVDDAITIDGDAFSINAISGSLITLNINATRLYSVGDVVTKEPLSNIYTNGDQIDINDLVSITNVTDASFIVNNKAEFNVSPDKFIDDATFAFTLGSRICTYSGSKDLPSILRERDWIKITTDASTTYMRVVDIVGTQIRCSGNYTGSTLSSQKINYRRPDYITDSSSVSIDCSGKTKDGTATGDLVETGADVVEDLLKGLGLTADIDVTSFASATIDNDMRISLAIPLDIKAKAPTVRSIINIINETVFGSLSLKQDFTLKYDIISADRSLGLPEITEHDLISWSMVGKETSSYKKVYGNYKFTDFNNDTGESGNQIVEYTSDRITNYDISNKEVNRDFYVYTENEAQELTERTIHFNEQTIMELKIISDLRLSEYNIGDKILIDFNRFIDQPAIGDSKRIFYVTGVKKEYNKVELSLTDWGDLFNRSAVMADEAAADYGSASSDDKRYSGYLTDENSIITSNAYTKGSNLIS